MVLIEILIVMKIINKILQIQILIHIYESWLNVGPVIHIQNRVTVRGKNRKNIAIQR